MAGLSYKILATLNHEMGIATSCGIVKRLESHVPWRGATQFSGDPTALYELLTGRPPFKAATPLDTIMQVVADDPVPPSQLQSRVPRDLETVCLKCLRKEPGQRYGSALELAEDLQRYLRDEPIQARPVRAPERLWRWCRRNPALAATAAMTLFALLGVAVLGLLMADAETRRARADAEIIRQQLEAEQQKREQDLELLWESFVGRARLERLAGKRWDSLETLGKATKIRPDDSLREEAVQALTQTGIRQVGEWPYTGYEMINSISGAAVSTDRKLLAAQSKNAIHIGMVTPDQEQQNGILVRELPSGKVLAPVGRDLTRSTAFAPVQPSLPLAKTMAAETRCGSGIRYRTSSWVRTPETAWCMSTKAGQFGFSRQGVEIFPSSVRMVGYSER